MVRPSIKMWCPRKRIEVPAIITTHGTKICGTNRDCKADIHRVDCMDKLITVNKGECDGK